MAFDVWVSVIIMTGGVVILPTGYLFVRHIVPWFRHQRGRKTRQ